MQQNWIIPGTALTGKRSDADKIDALFASMFLAGGLTLSQVASISGLEAHTIQNWVKRGFLYAPVNKRYDMEQVCRILNINILKGPMPLEQIINLMAYLNGDLEDESDDLVDDTMLFFFFVRLAARVTSMGNCEEWEKALLDVTESYREPIPGAREKLMNVLKVMLTAYQANTLKLQVDQMVNDLEKR